MEELELQSFLNTTIEKTSYFDQQLTVDSELTLSKDLISSLTIEIDKPSYIDLEVV